MLRPNESVGAPTDVEPKPNTGLPSYRYCPTIWRYWFPHAQFWKTSICASAPCQCEIRSSTADWSDRQGLKPRFGSIRCQACSAQLEPSDAVQAATSQASLGPVYGRQTLLIVLK